MKKAQPTKINLHDNFNREDGRVSSIHLRKRGHHSQTQITNHSCLSFGLVLIDP
jgi:hypothetical protein